MISLDFTVNGKHHQIHVDPRLTLLEVLRENLLLTGTKEGCGVGECGTCVVLSDGEPVTSCLILAGDADGSMIETVEGLAVDGELNDVQKAFVKTGAFQCGFCTPAMVLTATAMFRENKQPDIEQVRKTLSGILCRCGAYPKILEAVVEIKGGGS
jgi:carbon-monoxide dehydrogenase small subunit